MRAARRLAPHTAAHVFKRRQRLRKQPACMRTSTPALPGPSAHEHRTGAQPTAQARRPDAQLCCALHSRRMRRQLRIRGPPMRNRAHRDGRGVVGSTGTPTTAAQKGRCWIMNRGRLWRSSVRSGVLGELTSRNTHAPPRCRARAARRLAPHPPVAEARPHPDHAGSLVLSSPVHR